MYQKYYTDALVLRTRESGEEDKIYVLYTRDFGLVVGRAKAVRSERSRMRYALQSYAHVTVALVRGKNGWRIAGASSKRAFKNQQGLPIFVRIAELVLRLVTGEEKNEYLFRVLAEAHEALQEEASKKPLIEIVCVARILYALGYLSSEALKTTLFAHTAYTEEHLKQAQDMHTKLLSRINRAISEAQL